MRAKPDFSLDFDAHPAYVGREQYAPNNICSYEGTIAAKKFVAKFDLQPPLFAVASFTLSSSRIGHEIQTVISH